MTKLTCLTLQNFQTHRNLKIRLDTNVTTIVGASDKGKSAVLRALRWLALNDPTGDAFIRRRSPHAKVTLTLNGHAITRKKGKGTNYYSLDGKKLKAFRTNVPDKVASLLNIGEINFQDQHDAPFWFSLSAGQVSRELNQIVNLEVMDSTLSNITSQLRKAKIVVEVTEERIKAAEQQVAELDWVEECNVDLERLEQREQQLDAIRYKRAAAALLLESIQTTWSSVKTLRRRCYALSECVTAGESARAATEQRAALEGLLAEAVAANRLVKAPLPDPTELDRAMSNLLAAKQKRKDLKLLLDEFQTQETILWQRNQKVGKTEQSLALLTKGNCPVCGRPT